MIGRVKAAKSAILAYFYLTYLNCFSIVTPPEKNCGMNIIRDQKDDVNIFASVDFILRKIWLF